MSDTVGTVLLTREQIEERAREIGEEIARDYEGEEVYLIGTLRGAVVWMADMMKNIKNDIDVYKRQHPDNRGKLFNEQI